MTRPPDQLLVEPGRRARLPSESFRRARTAWLPTLLLSTLGLLALVVTLAEVIPRLIELPEQLAGRRTVERGLFVSNDAAAYVMQPYYSGRGSTTEYDQTFETNARGLRGPELEPKQAGEFRIVVIGDSTVFGAVSAPACLAIPSGPVKSSS